MIPRLTSLWRNLFHKDRVDHEFTEEIQSYVDMLTEEKIRQGFTPREARRNALVEVGGVEQVQERVREIRMGQFIETAWRDVRFGVRALVHSPIFTCRNRAIARTRDRRQHCDIQCRQWSTASAFTLPRTGADRACVAHAASAKLPRPRQIFSVTRELC